MNQHGITFTHLGTSKTFFLADGLTLEKLATLIKTGFRATRKLLGFKASQGQIVEIKYFLKHLTELDGSQFDLLFQEEEGMDRKQLNRSCSRKKLLKSPGRSAPLREEEISDQKYYVEDFQLFMHEVSTMRKKKLVGILFFDDPKNAHFFGKKMLRELLFEFSSIEFYYSLYPSKRSAQSLLLGPTILFSFFYGKHLILQRQFCQRVTSVDEIIKLIHYLINSGELTKKIKSSKSIRPLMQSNYERNKQRKKARRESLSKAINLSNDSFSAEVSKVEKKEYEIETTPISNLKHDLSFQNFSEEEWPSVGSLSSELSMLNYTMYSYLKSRCDPRLKKMLQAVSSIPDGQQLEVRLLEVFLGNEWDRIFVQLDKPLEMLIKSDAPSVHKLLGQLGEARISLEQFIAEVKSLNVQQTTTNFNYSEIAAALNTEKNEFRLDRLEEDGISIIPIPSKNESFEPLLSKITDQYHESQLFTTERDQLLLEKVIKHYRLDPLKLNRLRAEYTKRNPYLLALFQKLEKQCFPGEGRQQIHRLLSEEEVPNLASEIQSPVPAHRRVSKLQNFKELMKYLHNENWISLRQMRTLCYLYMWQDLNVLSAYEVYIATADLKDFIQTVDIIEQLYYLQNRVEFDPEQTEKFSDKFENQLAILFAFKDYLTVSTRNVLERLLKVGDNFIIGLYSQYRADKNRGRFVQQLNKYAESMQLQIDSLPAVSPEALLQKQSEQRKAFVKKIHKQYLKELPFLGLINVGLAVGESAISAAFELNQKDPNLEDFCQSLDIIHKTLYGEGYPSFLLKILQRKGASEELCSFVEKRGTGEHLVRAAFQTLLQTEDIPDFIQTLQKINKQG